MQQVSLPGGHGEGSLLTQGLGIWLWLRAESRRMLKKDSSSSCSFHRQCDFLLLPPTSRTVSSSTDLRRFQKHPRHSHWLHGRLLLPHPRLTQGAILAHVALLLGTEGQGLKANAVIAPCTSHVGPRSSARSTSSPAEGSPPHLAVRMPGSHKLASLRQKSI